MNGATLQVTTTLLQLAKRLHDKIERLGEVGVEIEELDVTLDSLAEAVLDVNNVPANEPGVFYRDWLYFDIWPYIRGEYGLIDCLERLGLKLSQLDGGILPQDSAISVVIK